MATPKKRKKLLIFSAIAVVLVALGIAAALRKKEPVYSVQTEKVARRDLVERVIATGKIQPVTQVVISPEVAGEIVKLPFKEGDPVKKGDLLVQIRPDNYQASRNSAEANYRSAIASRNLAQAQLEKAEAEFKRNQELFNNKLESDSVFLDFKTAYEVSKLQFETAVHQEAQAKFGLDKAADDLSKTTIESPIDGTIVRLKSQLGERVLGTSFNMGTEIMTVANLSEMEARVDLGEVDVVLIKTGQVARLEVDAFKNRKFTGNVSEVANSAKGLGSSALSVSSSQDATKFEVRIRIKEREPFLPGMSVTAEIETRSRSNVLTVPIASLTTRMPKGATNSVAGSTNSPATNAAPADPADKSARADRKSKDTKPVEVVFLLDGDRAKMAAVKSGISDDDYYEITDGLKEGDEVVSGGFKAIRELEDGRKVIKGGKPEAEKKEP
ncbi:MAG: efflux RND transporter periplasmic adaptor subunit [Verrucomicrobiota bacterium]